MINLDMNWTVAIGVNHSAESREGGDNACECKR